MLPCVWCFPRAKGCPNMAHSFSKTAQKIWELKITHRVSDNQIKRGKQWWSAAAKSYNHNTNLAAYSFLTWQESNLNLATVARKCQPGQRVVSSLFSIIYLSSLLSLRKNALIYAKALFLHKHQSTPLCARLCFYCYVSSDCFPAPLETKLIRLFSSRKKSSSEGKKWQPNAHKHKRTPQTFMHTTDIYAHHKHMFRLCDTVR